MTSTPARAACAARPTSASIDSAPWRRSVTIVSRNRPPGSPAEGTRAQELVGLVDGEDDVEDAEPGDGAARERAQHEQAQRGMGLEEVVRLPERGPGNEDEDHAH